MAAGKVGPLSIYNNGSLIASTLEGGLNFKPGTNTTVSVVDNAGNGTVDITYNSSAGGGGGGGFVSGELGYAQFISNVNVGSGATEAAPQNIVNSGSINFTGVSGNIIITFYAPHVSPVDTSTLLVFDYYVDIVSQISCLGRIATVNTGNVPIHASIRLAAPSSIHTYYIAAWCQNGGQTASVNAGSGGYGNLVPGYIRVARA